MPQPPHLSILLCCLGPLYIYVQASRGVSEAPLLRIFWVLVLAVNLVELPSTASDSCASCSRSHIYRTGRRWLT